jgi:hypothetical protein
LERPPLTLSRFGVDAVPEVRSVQGGGREPEVADETTGKVQDVGSSLVGAAAVTDENGGPWTGWCLRRPEDPRDGVLGRLEDELLLDHTELNCLASNIHVVAPLFKARKGTL